MCFSCRIARWDPPHKRPLFIAKDQQRLMVLHCCVPGGGLGLGLQVPPLMFHNNPFASGPKFWNLNN